LLAVFNRVEVVKPVEAGLRAIMADQSGTSLQDLYSSPPDLSDNLPGIALGFPHRGRKSHGLHLSATRCGVFHHSGRPGLRLCGARQETVMTGFYLFGGIIAAGLLVYLIAALLFPEDFL
jgi:K+-transporting ATPase KdpF subunit